MKKSEEYLHARNILLTNQNVIRIFKLVEKHPNYEYFFIKSHFGSESVPVQEIERIFKTIQEKNIKISKSVDQYVKYIVSRSFEQDIFSDDGKKRNVKFSAGEDITDRFNFIHKENRMYIDQRTNFEAFSDEVRDGMIRLTANKIIQQFPAIGKKVVDELSELEKKEFYFNLNTLLETNTRYMAIMPVHFKLTDEDENVREFKYAKDKKLSGDDFLQVPAHQKKYFAKVVEKPLQAFIKKSARYKSKEALFADLNAALYSLSGDEEYKKTIETIEDTEGAILEGLNPKQGIIVASTLNADAYKAIGGSNTNHCIRHQSTFASYQKFGGKQYLIVHTKLEPTDDYRFIGLTIDGKGKITNAHTKSDVNILSTIQPLLTKWDVAQYVNPMTDDEIIEMLYVVINDETIFNSEERAQMVLKFLPKLDQSRFDKKKMLNLLKFAKGENQMKEIIRMSLDNKTSDQFLSNYDYLSHTILKLVNDDKQAHEIVMNYVREFNDTVGLTKEDCMKMLLNKSKYVQPNRLIEIIGKNKFTEYVGSYDFKQEEEILGALPQLFIYFLRDRKNHEGREIKIILDSMYAYEKREEIRKVVLKKIKETGLFKKVSRHELGSIFEKIAKDDKSMADTIQ